MNTKKLNIIKVLFLLSFIATPFQRLYCQEDGFNKQEVTILSPEAASLAKSINYPVNYNTGVPDIRIPLYELEAGSLKLPIELVYHAGGFKINEQAGKAGLGWSLSCDLQISRTVNGMDDLAPQGYLDNKKMKAALTNSLSTTLDYPLSTKQDAYEVAARKRDGMPDRFYYKLLNKSGSFYFVKDESGSNYTIVTGTSDNIKITYNNLVFTITDTDGIVYTFGGTPNALEYSLAGNAPRSDIYVSSWKCTSLHNPNNENSFITFHYGGKKNIEKKFYPDEIEYWSDSQYFSSQVSTPRKASESVFNGKTTYKAALSVAPFYMLATPKYKVFAGGGTSVFYMAELDASNRVTQKEFKIEEVNNRTTQFNEISSLSYIMCKDVIIDFQTTDHLRSIRVANIKNNREIRTINLFQSYTNSSKTDLVKTYNGNDFKGTNYLDSLQIAVSSISVEKYKFAYRDKFCFGNHLKGHDAWGYVNASTKEFVEPFNNDVAIPAIEKTVKERNNEGTFYIGGESKVLEYPDENLMQKGMLRRIVYPTGGFSDFYYEGNKYIEKVYDDHTNVSNILRLAGGLRIRTISNYEGNSSFAVSQKYYRYGEYEEDGGVAPAAPEMRYEYDKGAALGSARVWALPHYSYDMKEHYGAINRLGMHTYYVTETKTIYSPTSAVDLTYANGSTVYYPKVTEYQMDYGKNSGKTVYTYFPPEKFTMENLSTNVIKDTPLPYLKGDWYTGALKSVSSYTYRENRYHLTYRKENEYRAVERRQVPRVVHSFISEVFKKIDGDYIGSAYFNFHSYRTGQYGLSIGRLLLAKEKECWVENGDTLKQTTVYEYNNADYFQPSRIQKTEPDGTTRTSVFTYPYDFSTGVYPEMVRANMIAPVIEKTEMNGNRVTEKQKINYKKEQAKFFVPASVEHSLNGNSLETELTFDRYDENGNVSQITGKDGLVKSYLWGYSGRYPVAEVIGKEYSSVVSLVNKTKLDNPASESELKTELDKLYSITDPQVMVSTYTYTPLVGMTNARSPRKLETSYSYLLGRLHTVKDHENKKRTEYAYAMKGPYTTYANASFYTNPPLMESFNKVSGNQVGILNYIYEGGQSYLTSWGGSLYNLTTAGQREADAKAKTYPATEFVKIDFYSQMLSNSVVEISFMQEGSVVARKKYYTSGTAPYLYLPPGEYTMSFKVEDFLPTQRIVKYYFTSSNPAKQGVWPTTGTKIKLERGETYRMGVTDTF